MSNEAAVVPVWRRVKTCVHNEKGDKKWFAITFEDGSIAWKMGETAPLEVGAWLPIYLKPHLKEGGTTTYEVVVVTPITPEMEASMPKEALPPSMRPPAPATTAPAETIVNPTKKSAVTRCDKDGAPWGGNDGKMQTYDVGMADGAAGKMYAPADSPAPVNIGEEYAYHIEISPKKVKKIVLDVITASGAVISKDEIYMRLQCLNAAVALLAIPGQEGEGLKPGPTTATLIAKAFEKHILRVEAPAPAPTPSTTPVQ